MSKPLSTRRSLLMIAALAAGLAAFGMASQISGGLDMIAELEADDPLFDFPGLLPSEWPEAISIIRDANRTVLNELSERMRPREFYPLAFWETGERVARAREPFQVQPTWLGAWRLLRAEEAAAAAYAENLKRFADFFAAAMAENSELLAGNPIFVFFPGTATDATILEAALDTFGENASALGRELSLRKRCLLFGLCAELRSRAAHTGNQSREASEAGTGPNASQRILPRQQLLTAFSALQAQLLDDRFFIAPADCFGGLGSSAPFLLGALPTERGRMALLPKLATNSLFRPIRSTNRYPQDELPHRAGYAYAWQPETSWYLCTDLSYYPILATMHEIVRRSASQPLAGELAPHLPSPLADALRAQETRLGQPEQDISAGMIAEYIGALRAADEHLDQLGRPSFSSELTHRIRLWETKSGGFASVLEGLRLDARTFANTAQTSRGENLTLSLTAAIVRSHLSLLLAPWNPSVWRLARAPRFLFADREPRTHLVDYWTLRHTLGDSALQEIQRLTAQTLIPR